MKQRYRVVLDVNVLISASFRKKPSIPNDIHRSLKAQEFILVISQLILKEMNEVLNRDYIIALTRMTTEEISQFMTDLRDISVIVEDKQLSKSVGRDRKDEKFLACALEGNADFIVTGDKDLLTLNEYEGIKIITPKEFVSYYI